MVFFEKRIDYENDVFRRYIKAVDIKPPFIAKLYATILGLKPISEIDINKIDNNIEKIIAISNDAFIDLNLEFALSKKPEINAVTYFITKDISNFEKLTKKGISHREVGELFGYPEDAAKAYNFGKNKHSENKEKLLVTYNKNIKIPDWLAYLDHLPETFDPVNNKYSESSMRRAKELQKIMHETVPDIAKLVEDFYFNNLEEEFSKNNSKK